MIEPARRAQVTVDPRVVDDMVAEGLVAYVPIPDDAPVRASHRLRLTDAGWAEAGRLRRARAEAALERV